MDDFFQGLIDNWVKEICQSLVFLRTELKISHYRKLKSIQISNQISIIREATHLVIQLSIKNSHHLFIPMLLSLMTHLLLFLTWVQLAKWMLDEVYFKSVQFTKMLKPVAIIITGGISPSRLLVLSRRRITFYRGNISWWRFREKRMDEHLS